MDTIFMISENSKTSKPHFLILKLTDKLNLRRGEKTIALSDLSISYTCKNIKTSYNNNKFKLSDRTWNDKIELPDGSYAISDIQYCFEYIQKNNVKTNNPLIRIYVYKIENRFIFKIKTGYYLDFLTIETIKLLGSTENKIAKDKNAENIPHLETTELVLLYCNIVSNDYQQDSRIYIYLFQINHLVVNKFHQQILSF